jgi:hypothetical protein
LLWKLCIEAGNSQSYKFRETSNNWINRGDLINERETAEFGENLIVVQKFSTK